MGMEGADHADLPRGSGRPNAPEEGPDRTANTGINLGKGFARRPFVTGTSKQHFQAAVGCVVVSRAQPFPWPVRELALGQEADPRLTNDPLGLDGR